METTLKKYWVVSENSRRYTSTQEDSQPLFSLGQKPPLPTLTFLTGGSFSCPDPTVHSSIPPPISTSCFLFRHHQHFPVSREDNEPGAVHSGPGSQSCLRVRTGGCFPYLPWPQRAGSSSHIAQARKGPKPAGLTGWEETCSETQWKELSAFIINT